MRGLRVGTARRRWTTVGQCIAAGFSGFLIWLAFPGHNLWPLAPVGLAGWVLLTHNVRPRRAALLGLFVGLGMFLPMLTWSGIYVGKLPWVALALVESLYLCATSTLMPLAWRLIDHANSRRSALVGSLLFTTAVAGVWILQEAIRSRWPFGGFAWGRVAFAETTGPWLGLAALGGAPAVSFVTALAGAVLALVVLLIYRQRGIPGTTPAGQRDRWLGAALAAATLALATVAGLVSGRPDTSGDPTMAVAAIQGNVPRPGLDFNAERRAVLDNHVRATLALAEQRHNAGQTSRSNPAPAIIFWPENSSDIDPLRDPVASQEIQRAADASDAPVVVGAVLANDATTLLNAAIVWGPRNGHGAPPGPGQTYFKRHPAPFAEYVPLRPFVRLFNSNVDRVSKEFVPGNASPLLNISGTTVGTAICFEVAYDQLVRDSVRDGAQLLFIPTNNATFGYSDESVQQLAMSRLRAVESGRAVAHVSTVGVSALIAPDGTLLESSPLFEQSTLTANLPLRTEQTLSTRLGGWPELAFIALAIIGLGVAGRRPPRTDPVKEEVG